MLDNGGPVKTFADNVQTLVAGGTVSCVGRDFSLEFYVDTISNAPMHTMSRIKCPVLFTQGQKDGIYRRLDAQLGYELMMENREGNLDSKTAYAPIDDGNHDLDNVPEIATNIVFDWIKTVL